MREALDAVSQPVRVEIRDRRGDPRVQRLPPLGENTFVRHLTDPIMSEAEFLADACENAPAHELFDRLGGLLLVQPGRAREQ